MTSRFDPDATAPVDRPTENVLRVLPDGRVEWAEKREGFPMGYVVTRAQRDAGYVPTAAELAWGKTLLALVRTDDGRLVPDDGR